jgi:hypothetical protein
LGYELIKRMSLVIIQRLQATRKELVRVISKNEAGKP